MIELLCKPYDVNDFIVVTPAETSVIDLEDAKLWIRVDDTLEDSLVFGLIQASTQAAENYSWLQSNTVTYKSTLTHMPRRIKIWKNPIQSITHVKYYDKDNAIQTLAADKYSFATIDGCATIVIKENITTYERLDAVEIQYVAGFGVENTPGTMKTAIGLLLGHYYEHREAVAMGTAVEMPYGVTFLLDMIKLKRL